ncbi:MAG: hypothetical protein RL238_3849 [Actinomycetota bacterium]|jgi:DNA-binding MarR family transcriptional regulator
MPGRSARAALTAEQRMQLAQAMVLVRRMSQVLNDGIDRAGLSEVRGNAEIRVCLALYRGGALRPRDLQDAAGLTSGGLTKLLDRLQAAELVRRSDRGSATDGRAVEVRLTNAGRRTVTRLIDVIDAGHDDVRPFAKEILMLVEACGGGPSGSIEPCVDLIPCLARLGSTLIESFTGTPGSATSIDYSSLIVLCHASLEGGCRPGSLMELLDLSSGGATKLLDRLEHDGLIRRDYGSVDSDRRAVMVNVTARGRTVMTHALTRASAHLDELWVAHHWLAEGVSVRR